VSTTIIPITARDFADRFSGRLLLLPPPLLLMLLLLLLLWRRGEYFIQLRLHLQVHF
jgi:hypothetical protein